MTADSMWYKLPQPGTGTAINNNSVISMNYTLYLMNNTNPDANYYASTNLFTVYDLVTGTVDGYAKGLKLLGKAGGTISIIVHSNLAYGTAGASVRSLQMPV